MSVIFMDGFDYYNNMGPGGRNWDQGSSAAFFNPGRFGGQSVGVDPQFWKTFSHNYDSMIIGFATQVTGFQGGWFGLYTPPQHPFLVFQNGATPLFSVWYDPTTWAITFWTGRGENPGALPGQDTMLWQTTYVPPITLWYFLEIKFVMSTGTLEVHIDENLLDSMSGLNLGGTTVNRILFNATNNSSGGIQWGIQNYDDLYIIGVDGNGANDFLGEVRIQTKYPDADGYQDDFLRSQGLVNSNNVNNLPWGFGENGKYNYSGTVGAIDLYSIGNFTVSGTIFAVQENISFKKDDVGNRKVAPMLRTAATNYIGSDNYCYSTYTYGGQIWEVNPNTNAPWDLTTLNLTEFGMTVTA